MGFMVMTDVIRSKKIKGKRNPKKPFVISNEKAFFLSSAIFVRKEPHSNIKPLPSGEYFRFHHLI